MKCDNSNMTDCFYESLKLIFCFAEMEGVASILKQVRQIADSYPPDLTSDV